ncbi:MAG: response regulator transcription factor [Leptospiraceae bacterium]|nr:response regulator transcription factor [Leptospiraceae bacterium]
MSFPVNGEYRIVLADDHKILRLGLSNLLARNPELSIVGEAGTGLELIALLADTGCDLIILDLSMPDMTGIEVLDKLREIKYKGQVLVFTMHKEQQMFKHALKKGVDGYLLKDDNFDRILDAIRDIRNGRKAFSSALNSWLVQDFQPPHDLASFEILTRREKEILCMIAAGATSKEIAEDLDISYRTVQTHRSNVMEKLDIHNTAGIVKFAIDNGLV